MTTATTPRQPPPMDDALVDKALLGEAQRFSEDYWLYVVVKCKTRPELHLIQGAAAKLSPKEEVSVVRHMIGQRDWQRAAEATL
jgi:hypothetical protein